MNKVELCEEVEVVKICSDRCDNYCPADEYDEDGYCQLYDTTIYDHDCCDECIKANQSNRGSR